MKIVRYFFVGGAVTVLDISLFYLGAGILGYPWFPVALLTFLIATVTNYFLSIRFVFESGARFKKKRHELVGVFIVSTIGLALNQTILYIGIEIFKWHLLFAKCAATGIVFFINYYGRKRFVF